MTLYCQFMSAEGRLSVWLNSSIFPAEQVMKLTVEQWNFRASLQRIA